MSIDWDKAPEGATHWDNRPHADKTWMRPNYRANRGWDYWGLGSWIYYGEIPDSQVVHLIARPDAAPWDGSGLPPVGASCELRAHKLNVFSPAIIRFASRNVVVWDWADEPALNGLCTAYVHDVEMRPMRTAEQVAADEKKAAVAEMVYGDCGCEPDGNNTGVFITCGILYDAGYRKQVQP